MKEVLALFAIFKLKYPKGLIACSLVFIYLTVISVKSGVDVEEKIVFMNAKEKKLTAQKEKGLISIREYEAAIIDLNEEADKLPVQVRLLAVYVLGALCLAVLAYYFFLYGLIG